MKQNIKLWWVFAIGWCVLIALATRAPQLTGESTEAMLNNPFFDSAVLNFMVRKATHMIAFGVLAVLFWFALAGVRYRYGVAWLLATTYGAIDEWHQTFIPDRTGQALDVVYDSGGAFLILIIIYVFKRR